MPTTAEPINYWPQTSCAKAFWGQHELPPYRQLLDETVAWLEPRPGERWLDLGCGGGRLTRALWLASGGNLAAIVGLDCAAANAIAYDKLRAQLQPAPGNRVRFLTADFSVGLPFGDEACFDGVVSGLAIQYAQSYSPEQGWTTAAYDRVLAEVYRVLRPGGRFVFSVNVPEPSWGKVALQSLLGAFVAHKPLRYLQKAWAMWSYGGWLKREARRGRFHYLPGQVITEKLAAVGFTSIERRRSFARQAYLFRCAKP